jgi:hypothetical protein
MKTKLHPVMTPDEAERAFMKARYDVSSEVLAKRTTAAPDMGGSLLVELNKCVEQKMTTQDVKSWRELGDIHLHDARQPELSGRSRTDAAFDACYMYARCIVGEKSMLYTHPDASIFLLAAAELGWVDSILRPARQHVHERDNPLRDASQFEVLMVLALRLKGALGADDVFAEGPP